MSGFRTQKANWTESVSMSWWRHDHSPGKGHGGVKDWERFVVLNNLDPILEVVQGVVSIGVIPGVARETVLAFCRPARVFRGLREVISMA